MNIGNGVASWIRTVVPGLWALAVGVLLQWWTGIPTEIADALDSEMAIGAITWVILALWYGIWRWLEPRLPNWLTSILFGLSRQPTYANENTIPGELVDDGYDEGI